MKDNRLGSILFELRKEKNISQKDLATKLNVSDKAISRWETGKSSPDLDMLFQISKIFKVSFNSLLTARLEDDKMDENLAKEIIREFNDMSKKNSKRIRFILATTFVVILVLSIAVIFTSTFNRFKVYKVGLESNEFIQNNGFYVETRIKDTLFLNDLKIKDVKITKDDTVSVDLYFVKNNHEYILQNYSSLENINFTDYQSYIKIGDLSNYKDCLFLRVRIIDKKNIVTEYVTKLKFALDFSNSKIFYNEDYEFMKDKTNDLTKDEIIEILIKNGYVNINDFYVKETNGVYIYYNAVSNKINYNYEENNFSYRYNYYLDKDVLEIMIFDENNVEVENYKYDIQKEKVTECKIGSCNNYKEALKILNKQVLNLLKK